MGYGNEMLPKRGQVYTVRDTEMRTILTHEGVCDSLCIRLVEIVNPVRHYSDHDGRIRPWEPSFRSRRFRPVVERKTDISIFAKILDDVRKPVSVD